MPELAELLCYQEHSTDIHTMKSIRNESDSEQGQKMDKQRLTRMNMSRRLPRRSDDGYRGTYGTALICAGSICRCRLSCGACLSGRALRNGEILSDAPDSGGCEISYSCALPTVTEGKHITSVIKDCTPPRQSASCVPGSRT